MQAHSLLRHLGLTQSQQESNTIFRTRHAAVAMPCQRAAISVPPCQCAVISVPSQWWFYT